MKVSKGGFTWRDILDLDAVDFNEVFEASEELEKRIAEATKRG